MYSFYSAAGDGRDVGELGRDGLSRVHIGCCSFILARNLRCVRSGVQTKRHNVCGTQSLVDQTVGVEERIVLAGRPEGSPKWYWS